MDATADDDDFFGPAATAAADTFNSEAASAAEGEGEERQAKTAAVKSALGLAVELAFPDNSALEQEPARQRLAKLQETLLVHEER